MGRRTYFSSNLLFLSMLVVLLMALAGCQGLTGQRQQQQVSGSITAVNHIVIMVQENRSFDDYFGMMSAYRQANGIPINSSDGKINDLSGGSFSNTVNGTIVIPVAHTGSVCTEDLTPDWAEAHKEMSLGNPSLAGTTSPMDGFAQTAHDISVFAQTLGVTLVDQTGVRAMHVFDNTDLNYYYFMAANFAMSDNMFSPVPSRTESNRLYLNAATSQGLVHSPNAQLTAKTIWEALDQAAITWKIYIPDNPPFFTDLSKFIFFNKATTAAHIVPLSQYFTDVQNGTLPSVSLIETPSFSGNDEHPTNFNPDQPTGAIGPINVQHGAQFVSRVINSLMNSPSWKDSVFFWTMDEGGGLFDHVPPISVPNPDGISPQDLFPTDPPGDFNISGFRVPFMVISPFARKNYVSHTPADYTAILSFIETRYSLSALTRRDAAMPNLTEFFDFGGAPWATPPSPPAQNMGGACDFTKQ